MVQGSRQTLGYRHGTVESRSGVIGRVHSIVFATLFKMLHIQVKFYIATSCGDEF